MKTKRQRKYGAAQIARDLSKVELPFRTGTFVSVTEYTEGRSWFIVELSNGRRYKVRVGPEEGLHFS